MVLQKISCQECGYEFQAKNHTGMHHHVWYHVQIMQPSLCPYFCKQPGCNFACNHVKQIVKHVKDTHGIERPKLEGEYGKNYPAIFQEMRKKCFPEQNFCKRSAAARRYISQSTIEAGSGGGSEGGGTTLPAGNIEAGAAEPDSGWIQFGQGLKRRKQSNNDVKTTDVDVNRYCI